jgi:hypothetical protein
VLKDVERIELLRGNTLVSTFVGAFGHSLRETRLTALLGYLIALEPKPFLELFHFQGTPLAVSLENSEDGNRPDILLDTSLGKGIVEAKLNSVDPFKQSKKYDAKWKVLLTQFRPPVEKKKRDGVTYLRWDNLEQLLKKLSESKNSKVRFISSDLKKYLEENGILKKPDPIEIYAREINEPMTYTLFLKAQIYGCDYEKKNKYSKALYFAPHFGKRIARDFPGVHVGISYIAKIEDIDVVDSWKDIVLAVKNRKGKTWLNSHLKLIEPIKKWRWRKGSQRSFFFLSEPRLVFNPPINKGNLQDGSGWLSKKYFSFDNFFEVWGKFKSK